MGDLDRGLPRVGIAVEREQPVAAVRLDHAVHRVWVGKASELGPTNSPPRVLASLAEGHQPEEQLPARVTRGIVQTLEDAFGSPRERTPGPTDPPVDAQPEGAAIVVLGELGEGVLEEGQRARAVADVGEDGGQKPRFHDETGPVRRGERGVIASVRAASRSPKPRTIRGSSKKSARRVATTRTRLLGSRTAARRLAST